MADSVYVTKGGDRLDQLCSEFYGRYHGAVEYVLAANPKLAAYGPIFPQGVEIVFADIPAAEQPREIRLTD